MARIVGLSLTGMAGATLAGLVVAGIYGDGDWPPLLSSTVLLGGIGGGLLVSTRSRPTATDNRSAIRAVVVSWLVISAAGAVPYVLAGVLRWDLAIFESVSGLTGTGSTVLSPIEGNGHGLLFYRQLTQWVGGMGVVVLAVAVLPFLGVGGLGLFRAESPGPTADRLSARVTDTARRLWTIYCALTAVAVCLLLMAGMGPYDAVSHAATAVGTGGFSPYNDSISHFDSAVVEASVSASMFLGAVKFPLFHAALRRRDLRVFWRSSEFRMFVAVVVTATGVLAALNVADGTSAGTALRHSSFNVVSLMSSCGFGTADFTTWVPAAQLVLLFLMVSGAMAGSTSGALKLFRVQVVVRHAWREVRRVRRPRAVLPIRLGSEPVPEDVVRSVLGYVLCYFLVAVAGIVTLAILGADLPTSAGSVVTAMGGVGPGLGETGPASNFLVFDGAQRAVMVLLMLLGRLEIYPMLLVGAALLPSHRRLRPAPRGRVGRTSPAVPRRG